VNVDIFHNRHSGLLIPLFSLPSTESWGIGEILDVPLLARWMDGAGQDILQVLPINEMAPGQRSPYSAITAMAIDPIFISLRGVDDFRAAGGEAALDARARDTLAAVRAARGVEHDRVRGLKNRALRIAFDRFQRERRGASGRAAEFEAYVREERWWLDDYALFRTLHAAFGERAWTEWPEKIKARDAAAIEEVRRERRDEIRFRQYLQWLADTQWHGVRKSCHAALFGDLPFMVDMDSADVWAHQDLFDLDASVGVPPDAFSETGQNWGLPTYRWEKKRAGVDGWLRDRARRSAELFDGYRIDHLVGFYRTYVIPHDGSKRHFRPSGEKAQLKQGERVVALFAAQRSRITAEDLGTVPDFVRASLARLGVPGYRVLRWEREWREQGQPFRDPARYPAASVATSGTHDTDPLAVWWDTAPPEEREGVGQLDGVRARLDACDFAEAPFTPALRDVLLETLFASGSDLLILPVQDVFGWRERINVPATVNDENWTYRLPWAVDTLDHQPEAQERAARLREWARRYDRAR
jgi:4-alpha-glucanotransferase